jgi:phage terminase large subunit-like protein
MSYEALAADPLVFFEELDVGTAYGPTRFDNVMAPFQREAFLALAPSLVAVANGDVPPCGRFWIERTKGASKDSDLAVCLLWLLAFSPRPVRIQVAANDAEQADEIRQVIRGILRIDGELNELLASQLEVRADSIINLATGAEAKILTRDSKGGHGARPDVLIVNELTHIGDEEFAQTLADNLDKIPSGLGIIACNAGFNGSWQERWKAIATSSPRWWLQEFKQPAPWISPEDLIESEKRNPRARYRRLWWGEWAGEGDCLDEEMLQRALTLKGPIDSADELVPGWVVTAGLDLGLRHDRTALAIVGKHVGHFEEGPEPEEPEIPVWQRVARNLNWRNEFGEPLAPPTYNKPPQEIICHPGTNRYRLLATFSWRRSAAGPVSIEAVERAILGAHNRFRFVRLYADTWQAELLGQRLQRLDVPVHLIDPTGSVLKQQASTLLQTFAEGRVDMYAGDLLRDLRKAQIEERAYGFRVVSPRDESGHGDVLSAFLLALVAAENVSSMPRGPANDGQPLLLWP